MQMLFFQHLFLLLPLYIIFIALAVKSGFFVSPLAKPAFFR